MTTTVVGGVNLFHRAEFQSALMKHLPESVVALHFKKRLVGYKQNAGKNGHSDKEAITMYFRDGSTATCDVLIGTDGLHSATRMQMYKDMAAEVRLRDPVQAEKLMRLRNPKWTGHIAFRGVISSESLRALAPNHRVFGDGVVTVSNWLF